MFLCRTTVSRLLYRRAGTNGPSITTQKSADPTTTRSTLAFADGYKSMAPKNKNKITVSVEESDPLSDPVVVAFPGGAPVDEIPKFVQRRLRVGAVRGRTVLGKDSTCVYQASNPGKGYDGRRTKLCIGVYNKKLGTLTVTLAAEKGFIFCLEQSIPTYVSSTMSSSSTTERSTAAQRRKALFQDFGSTKKQKTLKSQEANRVTVDSVIGAGSLMAGAFTAQTKMSESNRKALEDNKRGEKVSTHVYIYTYLYILHTHSTTLPTFALMPSPNLTFVYCLLINSLSIYIHTVGCC